MNVPPSNETRKQMNEFLASLMELDFPHLQLALLDESKRLAAIKKESEYHNEFRGLAFFISYNIKPTGVSNDSFQTFKPLIQSLVDRGELKPSALNIFENP